MPLTNKPLFATIKAYSKLVDIQKDLKHTSIACQKDLLSLKKHVESLSSDDIVKVRGDKKSIISPKSAKEIFQHTDKLHTIFNKVKKLHNWHTHLDNMSSQLRHEMRGLENRDNALKHTEKLKGEIKENLDNAKNKLTKHVLTHATPNYKSLVSQVVTNLQKTLDKTASVSSIVAPIKDQMHFVSYIEFRNLEDSEGMEYDTYFIVITEVLNKDGSYTDYLTTMVNKQLPGDYSTGIEIKNATNAWKETQRLMLADKFHDILGEGKGKDIINVHDDKIIYPESIKKYIDRTVKSGNRITITFKDVRNESFVKEHLLKAILLALKSSVDASRRQHFRNKIYTKGKKIFGDFILTSL